LSATQIMLDVVCGTRDNLHGRKTHTRWIAFGYIVGVNVMNIAIYTSGDFPYGGAAENFVRQMALGLYKNNAQVEVIRLRGDSYSRKNDTPVRRSNYLFNKSFTNEALKFFELLCVIFFVPISLLYRKIYKKDQIVLLYGIEYAYLVCPFIFWSKIFRIKCYRIITDSYMAKSLVPVWWKWPKYFFYAMQYKHFDRHLNGVIVLSRYLYGLCIKNRVKKEKVMLIPHFIDLNLKNKKIPTNDVEDIICFCGTPSISNGIIDLVQAFAIVSKYRRNTKLLIIGKIPGDVFPEIKKLNDKSIHLTGYLKKDAIEPMMRSSSILVNPRQSGVWADAGFPTKLGEYFATKRPVVATRVGDLAYYFNDKEELVFAEPNNPRSLADAILFLLENKEKGNQIGLNGFNWASNNLDYIKNSQKLIEFLNCK